MAATARRKSPTATCSCRPRKNIRGTISNTDTAMLFEQFRWRKPRAGNIWKLAGPMGKKERHRMALPAYDQCIKASHVFNLLDARGVISVTERQSYILRVRNWRKPAARPGSPPKRAGRSNMPDLLLELSPKKSPRACSRAPRRI